MSVQSSRSRFHWVLYALVAVVFAAAVWYFARGTPRTRYRGVQPPWAGTTYPPPTPVRTVVAKSQDLPRHIQAIGTVTPLATVTVRSRVSGPVVRLDFQEGQRVERGQLLAEIDPAPYRIGLAQAEGQLQQNAARLKSAQADLERFRALHDKKLVTDQDLDAQTALVAQYQGMVTTSQAQVDTARLQLGWTRIEAPIAGRTGIRRIDQGNLVVANDTNGLVVLTQTRPIAVAFSIPEVDLDSVVEPFRAGKPLTVEVWDRNETTVLARGVLKTVDNQIDTTTGTLKLRAELPNEDERLFPNEFVNIRMHVGTLANAVVIPAAAVQFGSRGTYVYVINDQNKATVRDVVLGPADGTQQSVTKGLSPGDSVVVEGVDRLREGRAVVIVNDVDSAHATAAAP